MRTGLELYNSGPRTTGSKWRYFGRLRRTDCRCFVRGSERIRRSVGMYVRSDHLKTEPIYQFHDT